MTTSSRAGMAARRLDLRAEEDDVRGVMPGVAPADTAEWDPTYSIRSHEVHRVTVVSAAGEEITVHVIRQAGAVTLALAAIAVWFLMAPEKPEAPRPQAQQGVADRSSDITEALVNYEANEAMTQGAPQQSVVNGWVAKDLLTIIAEQQNDALTRDDVPPPMQPIIPNDDRVPALVGLLVVGLALALVTSPRPGSRDRGMQARSDANGYGQPAYIPAGP